MTRNGKIARLPKVVQEQLNRRLDDNEQGKSLVEWLNSMPEVQAITTAEFGGKPIREQNLSEWKKGGYRDWQRHQERRELVRQLEEEAGDLGTVMDNEAFNRRLSVVLTVDLAQAVRDVMSQATDPRERAECLGQLVGKFTQLRREESNAGRVRLLRERWERELAKAEENKRACSALMRLQALFLHQVCIDMFSRLDGTVLASVVELAADVCPDAASASTGLVKPNLAESDPIRPDPTGSN